jgi:hypothetical protein
MPRTRFDAARRQFELLQVLTTQGAHGGRCFSVRSPEAAAAAARPPQPSKAAAAAAGSTISSASSGGSSSSGAGATSGIGETLILAVANSRQGSSQSGAGGPAGRQGGVSVHFPIRARKLP